MTLTKFLKTIPSVDNHTPMVDVPVWVGLIYPEFVMRIVRNYPISTPPRGVDGSVIGCKQFFV